MFAFPNGEMPQAALDKRTAAASVDAYFEANLLQGQASSPSYEELKRRALKIREDGSRLFVHWTSPAAAVECQAVGPSTRCFCNHSWSSHAWYETGSKHVRCRVDGCKCTCFSYVPGRGSTHIRCACKHDLNDHRDAEGRPCACKREGCDCTGFHSNWRCGSCGETYDAHTTVFETKRERALAGKPTEENLGGWSDEKPHLDAVCGGVTRMSSLLSGVERTDIPLLPHTDGASAASASIVPAQMSSTAAVFANYDRRADAHVARLRKLKEMSESSRFAGGTPGRRLTAAVSTAPRSGAPSGARSGAAAPAHGHNPGRVAQRSGPPSKATLRELAASAAEGRAQAMSLPQAPSQAPSAAVASSTRGMATTQAASARPPSGRAAKPAGKGAAGGASGARGAAKAAVMAARRERAANAAEARLAGATGA